jgi:O-antigen/teichoic acid export membrane protein
MVGPTQWWTDLAHKGQGTGLTNPAIRLSIARLVAAGVTVGTYTLVARSLTPSNFAAASTYVIVATVLATFADFGSSNFITRSFSQEAPFAQREVLSAINVRTATQLVCAVSFAGSAAASLLGFSSATIMALIFLYPLAASSYIAVSAAALNEGRSTSLIVVTVSEKLVALSTTAATVAHLGSVSLVVGQVTGVIAGTVCLSINRSSRRAISLSVNPNRLGRDVRQLVPMFLSGAAAQLLNLDVPLTTLIAGPTASGHVAIATRFSLPFSIVAASFSSVFASRISRHHEPTDLTTVRRTTIGLAGVLTLLASPLLLAPSFAIKELVGDQYLGGAGALQVSTVGSIAIAISQPVGGALIARGRERFLTAVVLSAVGLGLVATAIGSHVGGATLAPSGRIVAGAVAFALSWIGWNAGRTHLIKEG